MKKILLLSVLLLQVRLVSAGEERSGAAPCPRLFGFYYNWCGNGRTNGPEIHWAHGILGKEGCDGPTDPIPGGENIASNFYPALKNYSSTDPATIARHVKMMAQARIGVVVVTWWAGQWIGRQ